MIIASLYQFNDFGLLALRLAVGAIFIYHGRQKWAMWKMQPSQQMPANMLNMMKGLSIIEPIAGAAILTGYYTQAAAAILAIIMIGAIGMKMGPMKTPFAAQDKTGWEFDSMILAGCIMLFVAGAGSILAIDFSLLG